MGIFVTWPTEGDVHWLDVCTAKIKCVILAKYLVTTNVWIYPYYANFKNALIGRMRTDTWINFTHLP